MSSPPASTSDLKVLWEVTGGPRAGYEPLRGEARCDVGVVGGGYTGLAAALPLATDGAKVSLIEADTIGFRASGRLNGVGCPP